VVNRYAVAWLSPWLLVALACSRSFNPCPRDMVRAGGRCVAEDEADAERDTGEQLVTDSSTSPTEEPGQTGDDHASAPEVADAGTDGGALLPDGGAYDGAAALLDARPPTGPLDATVDGDSAEASLPSVEAGAADASDGSSPDASLADLCGDSDLTQWREFQVSGQLMPTIATCFARDPRCATGGCDLVGCLRASVGVTECGNCIAEETRCTMGSCAAVCFAASASDTCRACACREGCIGGSAHCAMGGIDVCADCDGFTCTQTSTLDPALIMVVVGAGL
jgi:hypothetical protein